MKSLRKFEKLQWLRRKMRLLSHLVKHVERTGPERDVLNSSILRSLILMQTVAERVGGRKVTEYMYISVVTSCPLPVWYQKGEWRIQFPLGEESGKWMEVSLKNIRYGVIKSCFFACGSFKYIFSNEIILVSMIKI